MCPVLPNVGALGQCLFLELCWETRSKFMLDVSGAEDIVVDVLVVLKR